MLKLEQEILEAVEAFTRSEHKAPTKIIFPKPKWNDLLLVDIEIFGEPVPFIGRDGPQCLAGRKICGLIIEFRGFGGCFILE